MADGTPDDGPSLEMPTFPLRRRRRPAPDPRVHVPTDVAPAPPDHEQADREPRWPRIGSIGGLPAAAITGVVVGGLAVLIAWLAGAGCDAVRGTSSCGGAAGLPILLAGLVVLAWTGALLLDALGVADAGSTSLLAVGVLAVLVLVFLLGSLDEWWAVVAVPVASVVAYLGSWWVTTAVAGDEPGR